MPMQKLWCAMMACVALATGAAEEISRVPVLGAPLVPAVVVVKLRAFLAGNPPAGERRAAVRDLAEALLATGRAGEALEVLPEPETPEERVIAGRALAALGEWAGALAALEGIEGEAATLARAECLAALERLPEAVAVLERLPGAAARLRLAELHLQQGGLEKCEAALAGDERKPALETKGADYLRARLALARGRVAEAEGQFGELLRESRGLNEAMVAGAALGVAEARQETAGPEAADEVLEAFISQHAGSPQLGVVFEKLDDIYARQNDPQRGALVGWTKSEPANRAALANFYLAKAELREGKPDHALGALERFLQNAGHPMLAEGWLLRARILGNEEGALDALDAAMRSASDTETKARVELAAAELRLERGEYRAAAELYRSAAGRGAWAREAALFEAARAWLRAGESGEFLADYRALSAAFPESDLRARLVLEQGLQAARAGDAGADRRLEQFLRDFPESPGVPAARIALAELAAFGSPRDLTTAGRYLRAANVPETSEEQRARADYLAIFVADEGVPRDDEAVIAAARNFLEKHPNSTLSAGARMKLGQIYFRREEYPSAQTQLETLARESPASPLAEPALFLAGQAAGRAMNVEGALDLFEQVARRAGPLKLYARQEQAIAKKQLGKQAEAVVLYDSILAAEPPAEAELRFAALSGKGDCLVALGGEDPASLEAAVAVYARLAAEAEVTAHWRNQALYKKAKALEKLGRGDDALVAYADALEGSEAAAGPEYFWSYKAGFDAANVLEERKDWTSAIGLYQKMSALEGPRAAEAKKRLTQLRLEHFLWEE